MRALVLVIVVLMLPLPAAWCVNGTVTTNYGKPVAKAKVFVFPADEPNPKPAVVYTGADGKFSYELPKGGRYNYLVAADGFSYAMASRGKKSSRDVNLVVWPEKKVVGHVVDENGGPVSGAHVRIGQFYGYVGGDNGDSSPSVNLGEGYSFAGFATTDKDGRFTLLHIPDPKLFEYFSLDLEEQALGRARLQIYASSNDQQAEIKIVAPPACCLWGRILLPGKTGPAPKGTDVVVKFTAPAGAYDSRSVQLDKDGKFVLRDLPPGPAEVSLSSQDNYQWDGDKYVIKEPRAWALPAVTDIQLSPKRPANIEMVAVTGAVVRGKVVDKATGKAASRGYVTISHGGRASSPDQTMIGPDGQFAARVAPGDVTISVRDCTIDGKFHYFDSDGINDATTLELKVADGEQKTDLVLAVDATADQGGDYEASRKPIPADFEMKPGVYDLTWDPDLVYGSQEFYMSGLSGDKAKAKMRKLPGLKSKTPTYVAARFDGADDKGLLLAVFDESGGTGTGLDTAYFDVNRNGDLSDDTPIKWRDIACYSMSPWITVPARQGSGAESASYPVKVKWRWMGRAPMPYVRKGGWKGKIDSSQGPIEVKVVDCDGNGLFNDRFTLADPASPTSYDYKWGDLVFVDTNGFGKATTSEWGSHCLVQGGANPLGEKAFVLNANALGNKLTVAAYTGAMGRLVIKTEDVAGLKGNVTWLGLISKERLLYYPELTTSELTLPAGRWNILNCSASLQKDKDTVKISGSLNKIVEVKPGGQTIVTISGKPQLRVLPDKREVVFRCGVDEPMAWDILIGDSIKGGRIGDGRETPEPKVKFDGGELIALKPIGGG